MYTSKKGTPKTLQEAIQNGIDHFLGPDNKGYTLDGCITMHVRDYFNQRLAALMLTNEDEIMMSKVQEIMRRAS